MSQRLLPVLLLVLVAGCSRHDVAPPPTKESPTLSPSATVAALLQPAEIEVFGTVRGVRRAVLAFRVMGTVEAVDVGLGQRVEAGEGLARVESADLRARLTQAEAALNTARRDAERERALAEKGASTAESVRALQDRLAMAEASVRELQVQLSYATLRAPFRGAIAARAIEPGDVVSPGQRVLEIEGEGAKEIEASVPQSLGRGLSVGATVRVTLDVTTLDARLREVSAAADSSTRSLALKLDLPPECRALPGSFARLHLPDVSSPVLVVPEAAVVRAGQLEGVYVAAADGVVNYRLVRSGARSPEGIEVLSGLADGERVVADAIRYRAEMQPTSGGAKR
jgi:RND family efflux transporter MFP subunit